MGDLDPLSQARVEKNISELGSELSKITAELYDASRNAAQARHEYRVAYARAYLDASGPIPQREAQAILTSEDALLHREVLCALEESLKEAGRNVRAQLEGQRSLAANIRGAITYASGEGG